MKKILIICSGGMSSAMIVNALEKEAKKQNYDLISKAVGEMSIEKEFENEEWDLVLVAPQIRHKIDSLKKVTDKYNKPIVQIIPQAYSPLGGPKLLEQVINSI